MLRQHGTILSLGSLLFIPNLADGISCYLWQATSLPFPFLHDGDNDTEDLCKTVSGFIEDDKTADWYGSWLLFICANFVSSNLGT